MVFGRGRRQLKRLMKSAKEMSKEEYLELFENAKADICEQKRSHFASYVTNTKITETTLIRGPVSNYWKLSETPLFCFRRSQVTYFHKIAYKAINKNLLTA
jgi:hypothetical protein